MWQKTMLKNYLIITLRNIKKHKGYSFINITGLAVGMTCCMLIWLFVRDELSFDRYHTNANRIYRLEPTLRLEGQEAKHAVSAHPMGPAFVNDIPEIQQSVRFWMTGAMVQNRNHEYVVESFVFADANLFDVFSFSLHQGDPNTALVEPYSLILTQAMAERYLDDGDPIGQTLTLRWEGEERQFHITGILQDIPRNSHFAIDFLASYASLNTMIDQELLHTWFDFRTYTYFLLEEGVPPERVVSKFPDLIEKYMGESGRRLFGPDIAPEDVLQFHLRPLTDVYLHSDVEYEIGATGSLTIIYIFSMVGVLILVIAGINFVNLATARSANRAKEVGIRKVSGANRTVLIRQFLGEAVLFAFFALGLAMVLTELLLPAFNVFTTKELTLDFQAMIGFLLLTILVGFGAGIYPAFVLSAFQPAQILRRAQRTATRARSPLLRKGLVVFQFAVSSILIIGMLIISAQMNYIKHKPLGFDKEQILLVPLRIAELGDRFPALKAELLQQPEILRVANSNNVLGRRYQRFGQVLCQREADPDRTGFTIQFMRIDEEFIPTLGIEVIAGRNFSTAFATDVESGYLLNEAAVKKLGWASPEGAVGKELVLTRNLEDRQGKVIGVMKDFHFATLHQPIEPLVFFMSNDLMGWAAIKIHTADLPGTLASIQAIFKRFIPDYPFTYTFLDARIDRLYRGDRRIQKLFGIFTLLAISIACLGLFGLASFTTEQRTKEIGIRKALGASVTGIVLLLLKEFSKWIVIANVIAWPVAYWIMDQWLQSFAYRIEIQLWVFVVTALSTFALAMLTVSWQAIKTALANPVEALRYE
jgi:putative ABC transport system permease protein